MNYLIKNNKGRVLANPKIILTNGQESVIDLSSDYIQKITTDLSGNSGTTLNTIITRQYDIGNDNGIKITIVPFISPDGYITMDINPEYNTIKEKVFIGSEMENESDLAATLLSRRKLDLKGVRVKDGETLVIGGMIQESEAKSVTKIPFLGDLPVIGMFFRSTNTTREKEEMVIMLTPNIIVDNEDAETSDLL
jgi:type IV pilus assembly protein PilQ